MQATYNIKLYRNDTRVFRFKLENVDPDTEQATPVNLTNVNLKAQFRTKQDSPDIWAELPVTKTNAAAGQFQITINKSLSESLADAYDPSQSLAGFWDLQLTSNNGSEVYTPIKGSVSIERDVTREF